MEPGRPRAAVRAMRRELAERRRAVEQGFAELKARNAAPPPPDPREAHVTRLVDASLASARAADAIAEAEHRCALQLMREERDAEAARAGAALTSLGHAQRDAASDIRRLAEHVASRGSQRASASAVPLLATKAALLAAVEEQARRMESVDDAQRRAVRTRARRAREDQAAREAVLRAAAGTAAAAGGARCFRWLEEGRLLVPCELRLSADPRGVWRLHCAHAAAGSPGDAAPAVEVALDGRCHVAPTARGGYFLGGMVPSAPWLYVTLRWAGGVALAAARADGDGAARRRRRRAALHLAFSSREEAATWLVGLHALRPAGARAAWSRGRYLWLATRLMIDESARREGRRPREVLSAAVMQAIDDRRVALGPALGQPPPPSPPPSPPSDCACASSAHASIGVASRTGTHTPVNQDATFAAVDGSRACAAVFDGHSEHGELAAAAARDELRATWTSLPWASDPEGAMARAVDGMHAAALAAHARVGGEDADFGCTAVVAVLSLGEGERTAVVGNLGDSPALLLTAEDDSVSATAISEAHTVESAGEAARLRTDHASSATVRGGYLVAVGGPLAGHGLQPTRSLGHPILSRHGVIATPHVRVCALGDGGDDGPFAMVLCSDGVSDHVDDRAIGDAVAQAHPLQAFVHDLTTRSMVFSIRFYCTAGAQAETAAEAASALVEEAASLAELKRPGDVDDASAVVVCW